MPPNLLARPGSYNDLYAHYGNPHHHDFEADFIVTAHFCGHNVRCHRAIEPLLTAIDARLRHENRVNLVHTYDGCFVVRPIRGGTNPSLHSWGLAIDLNQGQFPLGSLHRQDAHLIAAFTDEGFFYGGDFYHRKDPMHFQWTKPHTI